MLEEAGRARRLASQANPMASEQEWAPGSSAGTAAQHKALADLREAADRLIAA